MVHTNVSSWDTMKCASSARDLAEHCYLPLSHNFYITQATFSTKLEHMLPRRGNLLITTDLKFVSVVPWRLCCQPPHLPSMRSHHDSLHHWQKELSTTATQFNRAQRKSTGKTQDLGTLIALMLSPPMWRTYTWWTTKKPVIWDMAVHANYCRFRASSKIWVLNYWHPWNRFHWSCISLQAAIPSTKRKKNSLNSCTQYRQIMKRMKWAKWKWA